MEEKLPYLFIYLSIYLLFSFIFYICEQLDDCCSALVVLSLHLLQVTPTWQKRYNYSSFSPTRKKRENRPIAWIRHNRQV